MLTLHAILLSSIGLRPQLCIPTLVAGLAILGWTYILDSALNYAQEGLTFQDELMQI